MRKKLRKESVAVKNGKATAMALIDSGSTATFIAPQLDELGACPLTATSKVKLW